MAIVKITGRQTQKRKSSLLANYAGVLALIALTNACTKATRPSNVKSIQKVTADVTFQPHTVLVHVAIANGYFLDEGIDFQARYFGYGTTAMQSISNGEVDLATAAGTPVMFAILKDAKIVTLSYLAISSENIGVAARRDAGISTGKDLKGKRVGLTKATSSDFFLNSLLFASGLRSSDVIEVDLKPTEMIAALTAGKVDAIATWNYVLAEAKQALGANAAMIYDREIFSETLNLVATRDFVEKNQDLAMRILRALLRAERFVADFPRESQLIMAAASHKNLRIIQDVWPIFIHKLSLDDALLLTMEDEARWAISKKYTAATKVPDFSKYIDDRPLKAARASFRDTKR